MSFFQKKLTYFGSKGKGHIYIFGRDHALRPILVVEFGKMVNNKEFYKDLVDKKYDFLEKIMNRLSTYIEQRLCMMGKVETVCVIANFDDRSYQEIHPVRTKKVKDILKILKGFDHYLHKDYSRLTYIFKIFCYNYNGGILDKISPKSFIGKRMVVVEDTQDSYLLLYANKSQFESKFGGKSKNIKRRFW